VMPWYVTLFETIECHDPQIIYLIDSSGIRIDRIRSNFDRLFCDRGQATGRSARDYKLSNTSL